MTAEEITVGGEGLFQIEQGEHGYGVYVGGKPLYEKVGGECDTCGGWFSLVDGPARPCTPADLSKRLGSGLDRVDRAIIDSFALLLPKGRYAVGLLRAIPFQRGDNERHWFESRAIQREVWRTMPAESRGCGLSNSGGSTTSILPHKSAVPCPDECTPLDGCPQSAWRYVQYDKKGEFTQVEQATKAARKGLWADANPVPPWE